MKHCCLWLTAWLMSAAVAAGQEQPLPKKVDLTPIFRRLGLTVRTQFGRPSCGTFAVTALAEFESARSQTGQVKALSEEFLWWACDQAAGLKKDHSVLFQRVVNGLNTFGICTEELMPYARKKDSPHKPSPAALKDAARRAERWRVIWIRHWAVNRSVDHREFHADALPVRARYRCDASRQVMKPWGSGMWSHGEQLFCRAEPKGFLEVEFHVKKAGRYRLRLEGTVAPDYGIIRMALDGKPTGPPFDLHSGMVGPSGPLELGVHTLAATKHKIRFTVVGKNAVSENFWFGVSTVDLLATAQEP